MLSFIFLALIVLTTPITFTEGGNPVVQIYRDLVKAENRRFIQAFNQETTSFHLRENHFIHLSQSEFRQSFGSYLQHTVPHKTQGFPQIGAILQPSSSPLQIDWRLQNKVSSVKNQGSSCSSCYSFTAIADIETSFLFRGISLDLSQQQIVDCTMTQGNNGCKVGFYYYSFVYAQNNFISSQTNYPYVGMEQTCKKVSSSYKISSFFAYNGNNCGLLKNMLSLRPVLVSLDGTNVYWQFYGGGVMNYCGANNNLNHGVQVVGIQTFQNGSSWWIAKNSWGTKWGQNGFIRLDETVNGGNICQVCSYIYYSIL